MNGISSSTEKPPSGSGITDEALAGAAAAPSEESADREQSLFQEVIDSFEADMQMSVNEEAWESIDVNENARYDEKIIVETESETGSERSSETENTSEPESETEAETESETTSEKSSSESKITVDGDDSGLEVNVFSN